MDARHRTFPVFAAAMFFVLSWFGCRDSDAPGEEGAAADAFVDNGSEGWGVGSDIPTADFELEPEDDSELLDEDPADQEFTDTDATVLEVLEDQVEASTDGSDSGTTGSDSGATDSDPGVDVSDLASGDLNLAADSSGDRDTGDTGFCQRWPLGPEPPTPESLGYVDVPCPPCQLDTQCPFALYPPDTVVLVSSLPTCLPGIGGDDGVCLQRCGSGRGCPDGQACMSVAWFISLFGLEWATACVYPVRDGDPVCPEGYLADSGYCKPDLSLSEFGFFEGCPDPGGDGPEGDRDNDGFHDGEDVCPDRFDPAQGDTEGDGFGDLCDSCPNWINEDPEGDIPPRPECSDDDRDGIPEWADLCPDLATDQEGNNDLNGDGEGDACDIDVDGDGVVNSEDNCERAINPLQEDTFGNPQGDACEDVDEDGSLDMEDNCLGLANPVQHDLDGDGVGDLCDSDPDGDERFSDDPCPSVDGSDANSDSDRFPDVCDVCPDVDDSDQLDLDDDGYGDACSDECWGTNPPTFVLEPRECEVVDAERCPPEDGSVWGDNAGAPITWLRSWTVEGEDFVTENGYGFGCGGGIIHGIRAPIVGTTIDAIGTTPEGGTLRLVGEFTHGCARFEGSMIYMDGGCTDEQALNLWPDHNIGPPEVTPVPDQTVGEEERLDVVIDVVDPDCRPVSLSINPPLPDSRITDLGEGRFVLSAWPSFGSACLYHVTATGRDAYGEEDNVSFDVDVVPREATSCARTSDCSGCNVCRNDVCRPARECVSSSDCPTGVVCQNGRCRWPCSGITCPSGETCVDGLCRTTGCSHANCPDGLLCAGGVCVERLCDAHFWMGHQCNWDGTCDGGLTCVDLGGSEGMPNMCTVSCEDDWECGCSATCADLVDIGRFCVKPCNTTADCPGGLACAVGSDFGLPHSFCLEYD